MYLGGGKENYFLEKFQKTLHNLKKEKQENYVNSFQSNNYITYGPGFTSFSEEKKVGDFIHYFKHLQNKPLISGLIK